MLTTFDQARQALSQFYGPPKAYSLDTIQEFMHYLGDPQDKLRIIHVAGTSGKTSTCYYIAGLLKASGKTVGLTVSPHVDEINERVQVNLVPLEEEIFCRELSEFLELVKKSELPLSYFEVVVAFAYWYFAKAGVDYAVIEVGLGGRIDGTNVINRQDKVCVITNIGFDHTQILGDTLPKIAAEKAGIITKHNMVFTHEQPEEVIDIIKQASGNQKATLHIHRETNATYSASLPLFQQHNLGLAIEAASYVLSRDGDVLSEPAIMAAASTYVPARMEVVRYKNRVVIIDGAHNGQKMETLLGSVHEKYPGKSIAALVAFVDGDALRMREAVDELLGTVDNMVVTEFASEQDVPKKSVAADVVIDYAAGRNFQNAVKQPNPQDALEQLLGLPQDILLITGSFYLLNHIRPLIMKP
jgi:dihydrofolate synthase / folylpolyglutamate synthase